MAAYLASKVGGKRIKYMRLMKLMYLADRESFSSYGEPISYDEMFSMNLGLVLSSTLNVVKSARIGEGPWAEFFSPRQGPTDYFVGIKKNAERKDLDCLSDADIQVLDNTIKKFGGMDEWMLSEYMHENCPEWKFPDGSRIPVEEAELLRALGVPDTEAAGLAQSVKEERQLNRLFRRQ